MKTLHCSTLAVKPDPFTDPADHPTAPGQFQALRLQDLSPSDLLEVFQVRAVELIAKAPKLACWQIVLAGAKLPAFIARTGSRQPWLGSLWQAFGSADALGDASDVEKRIAMLKLTSAVIELSGAEGGAR